LALIALVLVKLSASSAEPAAHHYFIGNAVWSPDGSRIAWTEEPKLQPEAPSGEIWVSSADGTSARPIRIGALGQLAWLSNDELLYEDNYELFRLSLSGHYSFLVGGSDFTIDQVRDRIAWPSASSCPLCHGPILVKSIAGGPLREIGGDVSNLSPTFSPDGRRVAFVRFFATKSDPGRYEQSAGIWISPSTGGTTKQLTRVGGCPSWSPDGRWISYLDDSGVRVISPAGGKGSLLLAHPNTPCVEPRSTPWSPDSLSFAAHEELGDWRLVKIDVATRRLRVLTGPSIGRVRGFSWSPDSKKLLVTSQQGNGTSCTSLWVIDSDGSNPHRLRSC
jgi:Tol biopolymer transport system component